MLEDVLRVLDAAYRFDLSDAEWLNGLAATMHDALGRSVLAESRGGLGVLAMRYKIDQHDRLCLLTSAAIGMPDPMVAAIATVPGQLPPSYVRRTFGRHPCALASQAGGTREQSLARRQMGSQPRTGLSDIFVINGLDPTDHGIWIGLPLAHQLTPPPEFVATWTRVAVHLAAASRLRRRIEAHPTIDEAEAAIKQDGRIVHARGVAKQKEARDRLADSVRALERLRAKPRQRAHSRALAAWRGLVDARWTLVAHFESDGKRYLVAQCNGVPTVGLSDRKGAASRCVCEPRASKQADCVRARHCAFHGCSLSAQRRP